MMKVTNDMNQYASDGGVELGITLIPSVGAGLLILLPSHSQGLDADGTTRDVCPGERVLY